MSIVTNLGIDDAFFVVLPKPLDSSGTLLLVPHIITEGPLNASCHIVPILVTHGFQCEKLSDLSSLNRYESLLLPFRGS